MKDVIYIDDEPALCRAVRNIVREGIATFTDPHAAIAHIAERGAAVVICDYRMPGMTGLEVRARIADDIPFYLVSGELDPPSTSGITGVLAKPFPIEELLALVERYRS